MDRQEFVSELEALLVKVDEGIFCLELDEGGEWVTIGFEDGHSKAVNIAGDSNLAIIYDVVKKLLWPNH